MPEAPPAHNGRIASLCPVSFGTAGLKTVRLQNREDGLEIDQVVLSPATYLERSPGRLKDDTTVLAERDGS